MKRSTLVKVVEEWNNEWFAALSEAHGSVKFDDVSGGDDGSTRRCRLTPGERSWCGTLAGDFDVAQIQEPGSGISVATGAVIDSGTEQGADDLPVIVAVGMNYWQFGIASSHWPLPGWRKTGMRPRLDNALQFLAKECGSLDFAGGYHLLAANFFPWVTRKPWGKIRVNQLGEAMALFSSGVPAPAKHIARLAQKLKDGGDAPALCFHGVNNAVPALALEVVQEVRANHIATEIFFTDNLARSGTARNKIVLLPTYSRSRKSDTRLVVDD